MSETAAEADNKMRQNEVSSPKVSLVIVDDNPRSLELLATALEQPGLDIWTADDPEQGLDLIFERHPDIVMTDLVMPKISGLELLERIVSFDSAIEVLLMTAHYSTESAVEAIRKGASDYLNKPISLPALRERFHTMIDAVRRRKRALLLQDELRGSAQFEHIIGNSPAMWGALFADSPHCSALQNCFDHRSDRLWKRTGFASASPAKPGIVGKSRCCKLFGRSGNAV